MFSDFLGSGITVLYYFARGHGPGTARTGCSKPPQNNSGFPEKSVMA